VIKNIRSSAEIPKGVVFITCRGVAEILEKSMGYVRQLVAKENLDGWRFGEVRSLLCDQKQVYEYAALVAGERKGGTRKGRPSGGFYAN